MAQGFGEWHVKSLAKTAERSALIVAYAEQNPNATYAEIGEALKVSTIVVGKTIRNHKGVRSKWVKQLPRN